MQAYSRLKAYPQSIHAGRAVLLRDSIPAVLSFVGDSFRQLEQADSALWYYRRSLALKPMNETVLSKAVGILIDKEKYDEAIAQSEPFLAEDPDNVMIAPLKGLALYRKGDYEGAVQVFQRQEDIGNDSYPIHYYLGQSYWHTQVTYRAEKELVAAWQIDSSDVNLAYSIAAVKLEAYRSFDQEIKPWLDKAWEMIQPDPALASRLPLSFRAERSEVEKSTNLNLSQSPFYLCRVAIFLLFYWNNKKHFATFLLFLPSSRTS